MDNFVEMWNSNDDAITTGGMNNDDITVTSSSAPPSPESPPITLYEVIYDLSDAQEIVMSLLYVMSAILSILGSSTIVYKVIQNRHKAAPYDRLMLGLSCCDIVASLSWMLTPFLMPSETSGRVWASGTDATCTLLGTLTQFGFCAVIYNGVLSMYYLLTVRFGVKRDVFAVKYEPYLHILPLFYFLVTAIGGGAVGVYSEVEIGFGCWVNDFPTGCETEVDADGNNTCISDELGWLFGAGPTVLTFLTLLLNNIVIYRHVKRTLKDTPSSTSSSTNNRNNNRSKTDMISSSHLRLSSQTLQSERAEQHKRHTREVATQGFLYVATFLVAYIPAMGLRLLEAYGSYPISEAPIFPLFVLVSICLPLQGFFNMFVYNKPNFLRVRTAYPEASLWWSIRKAVLDADIPRLSEASRLSTRALKVSESRGGRISGRGSSSGGRHFSSDLDILHEDSREDESERYGGTTNFYTRSEDYNQNPTKNHTTTINNNNNNGVTSTMREINLLAAETMEHETANDDDHNNSTEEDDSSTMQDDDEDQDNTPFKPHSMPNMKFDMDDDGDDDGNGRHRLGGTNNHRYQNYHTREEEGDENDYEQDMASCARPRSVPNFGACNDYSSDEDFDLEAEYRKVFAPSAAVGVVVSSSTRGGRGSGARRVGFDGSVHE